jgi:hypothetical protein
MPGRCVSMATTPGVCDGDCGTSASGCEDADCDADAELIATSYGLGGEEDMLHGMMW